MRQLFFLFSFIFFLLSFSTAQQTDTLYILQTTDVHGNVQDYNYFTDKTADYGLARIYSEVVRLRRKHKNVVLLDGGDLLQGTPMIYYFNQIETDVPNPMILTLNTMQYDAFAVGNHDIEQGPLVYNRARKESHFPWLSANSLLRDGSAYFKPYTIIERNGIRIGIIGLTTPGIPMWLDKTLYPGIEWTDMVKTAKKYVKILRPQVDVLVGLFHAGFEAEYSKKQTDALGLPNENASRLVAQQVPGFDVVFAGHSHRPKPKPGQKEIVKNPNEPLLINAGSWGRNLGVAEIIVKRETADIKFKTKNLKQKTRVRNKRRYELSPKMRAAMQKNRDKRILTEGKKRAVKLPDSKAQDSRHKTLENKAKTPEQTAAGEPKGSTWHITAKKGWLKSTKALPPSPEILSLIKPYHRKTLHYIRTKIADLTAPLDAARSRFEDNATVELINKAQLDYTGADISFAASFNEHFKMPAGPIRIKDIYGMYRYENFLYTIEMTGQQIKDFLKYSARYFVLDNGQITASTEMPGYNYDMAEGIRYTIKVNRKKGNKEKREKGNKGKDIRQMIKEVKKKYQEASGKIISGNLVEDLIFIKTGKPLKMNTKYTVAMNSYRASGGGGHLAAAGIKKPKILSKSNVEMRTILAEYIKKQKIIRPETDGNWKLITNY